MSKNILLVDDEELVVRSLSRLLTVEGYSVTIARSGIEAIKKVKEGDFDLIIADVRMPELDGVETIRRIRAYLRQSNKKSIPEILITGYTDRDRYEEAVGLKVSDYLYKPFDNDKFLQIIKKNIG